MKSKALMAMAVAGTFAWASASAFAGSGASQMDGFHFSPASVPEVPEAMTTLNSLDWQTGGYKGWGPMANLHGPHSVDEASPAEYMDREREHLQHLAEVHQAGEQVWVANAPLRSEYDNIGAAGGRAGGGFLRFFGR